MNGELRERLAEEAFLGAQATILLGDDPFEKATAFIRGLEVIDPGEAVAVVCRVTTLEQKRTGSLDRQMAWACNAIRERGGKVQVAYLMAGLGGDSEEWLGRLDSDFGQIAGRGLKKVVFTELSRIGRSTEYGNRNLWVRPTTEQLERIRRLAEKHGLTIVCILPPDAEFPEERSYQTRRSDCCGRPKGTKSRTAGWCKDRAERFKPVALAAVDAGKSLREAAQIANDAMRAEECIYPPISHETVRLWVMRRREGADGGV